MLHTLVIDPAAAGKGLGRAFVDFYEQGAKSRSCRALRMDTNARNLRARALYKKLGFTQLGVIPGGFLNKDGEYEDIIPHYHVL